jgi:hypothetical protein
MVDALREAHRVLAPGGTVVDVRPISARMVIEVVTGDRVDWATEADAYGAAEDDASADAAVRQALFCEWFAFQQTGHFDFEVYCDTAADLKTYAEVGRRMRDANIPYEELEGRRREVSASLGQAARLCCHRPKMLSVYLKPGS